jgi:hypothetical protein
VGATVAAVCGGGVFSAHAATTNEETNINPSADHRTLTTLPTLSILEIMAREDIPRVAVAIAA